MNHQLTATRHINGKTYRYGYTTGSSAAGAAKGALTMLLSGEVIEEIALKTPAGIELQLSLHDIIITREMVKCAVVKDSGDDPDVTNGIKVYAKVTRNKNLGLQIVGGIGVGRVTKKGLQVAVGEAAINPVPMQMIREEALALLADNQDYTIEISVPEGVEIAQKTFNERLGVIGGISILGTSGIVVPMSDEAFKEALALELSILKERGVKEMVLTPGNYGENFIANHLPHATERTVTTSNFIGYMLHEAVRFEMQKVILVGHIGKLIKVAGGIFHTHSSVADGRNEIFAAHYMQFSGDVEGFRGIMQSNTTEEAIEYVKSVQFFNHLCNIIKMRCLQHIKNKMEIEVIIFSQERGLLGKTDNVDEWTMTYFSNHENVTNH
ncbi:MAG: cobalamin biosynthesis protein CbiD [Breznakibacter sp.]|nr:cobalamin biosynthesis protein CbiD [Breznakibacter sp.]